MFKVLAFLIACAWPSLVNAQLLINPYKVQAAGGGATPTLVASTSFAGSTSGGTTGAIDTTGATLLVMVVADFKDSTAAAVSDSKTNSWTALTEQTDATSGGRVRILYSVPASVGSGHTFTASGGATYCSFAVATFSGTNASPADQQNAATVNGVTTGQPGAVTPSVNNSLIITGLSTGTLMTPTVTGYTVINVQYGDSDHFGAALAYKVLATATAENPTWTFGTSANAALKIGTFKPQ